MLRRAIIFFAIAVYIVVVGCVLVPAGEKSGSSTHGASTVGYIGTQGPLKGLPLVSVTMQLQRTDWIDKYEQNIDEIAALGRRHGAVCRRSASGERQQRADLPRHAHDADSGATDRA